MTLYAPPSMLNKYVSFFWFVFTLGNVVGPMAARYLLRHFSPSTMLIMLSGLACTAPFLISWLPLADPTGDTPVERPVLRKPWHEMRLEIRARLAGPLTLLKSDPAALRIAVLSFIHGLGMNSYVSATLPRVVRVREQALDVTQALMWLGAGTILATLVFARIADRFGRRAGMGLVLSLFSVVGIMIYLELTGVPYVCSIPYAYVAGFLMGTANLSFRQLLTTIIPSLYKADSVPAFAVMQLSLFGGTSTGFLVLPQMSITASSILVFGGSLIALAYAMLHAPLFCTTISKDRKD